MRIGARPPCRQLGRKAKQKPSSALLPLRAVTLDGGGKAGGEVDAGRAPAQLAAQLGAVDGVAAVVAGAVAHPVEVVLRAAEGLQDLAQHGEVVALAVGTNSPFFPQSSQNCTRFNLP